MAMRTGKTGPEVIKLFSCSTQLSMKFYLLINVKMPTIDGILTFRSRKNGIIGLSEAKTRKCVYETLCLQPYACPEKRFKSERSATQTIKKLISSSTP